MQGFNSNNSNNNYMNNLKTININNNFEIAKNNYQEYSRPKTNQYNINYNNFNNYNYNTNSYNNYSSQKKTEEIISNDSLDSYYINNSTQIIKDLAYKENPNAKYRDYMEDKGKSILNFNSSENNALICLFDTLELFQLLK